MIAMVKTRSILQSRYLNTAELTGQMHQARTSWWAEFSPAFPSALLCETVSPHQTLSTFNPGLSIYPVRRPPSTHVQTRRWRSLAQTFPQHDLKSPLSANLNPTTTSSTTSPGQKLWLWFNHSLPSQSRLAHRPDGSQENREAARKVCHYSS